MITPSDVGNFFLVLAVIAAVWVLMRFGEVIDWYDRRKWDRRRKNRDRNRDDL